jgi:GntR family transcriptional regulator
VADLSIVDDLAQQLRREDPAPLHDQISASLRQRITSGRWPAHMRLPSEPDLAQSLGVSRGTIRRATRTLIDEGLLVQYQGRGTFVGSSMLEQPFAQEIISTADALDRAGIRYETTVIRQELTAPRVAVAAHLRLAGNDAQVVAIRRVRAVEGVPMYVLDNYVVASLCPGLEHADLRNRALFTVLNQQYGLVAAGIQRTFQAQLAGQSTAELLNVTVGSPLLYLEQISYDQDHNPIEYSDVWMHGDKVRLSAWLTGGHGA